MTRSDEDSLGALPQQESALVERHLDGWLMRASAMTEAVKATDMTEALRRLDERRHAPRFRLAFVGEFNRGKSTLINRLLERPLLPMGGGAVTAVVTSVLAGTPERLEVTYAADGTVERRPLTPASWSDLVARDDAGDGNTQPLPESAIAAARAVVDNAWLRKLDAELLDTPGAGDLMEQRLAAVSDALAQTDAAVFLVSALLPFSMTERDFLESQVLGRHIARVIVVVSQLDNVPVEERELVMRSVRTRVGQTAPQLQVVSSQPVTADETPEQALASVRARIEDLAATSDRTRWLSRQIAAQLLDTLRDLVALGETALEAATLGAEQRAEALRQQQNVTLAANIQWNQISTQLDQRALELETYLRERIGAQNERLVQLLNDDLARAHNPQEWLEKRYSRRLSRELEQIAHHNENEVLERVNSDIDWLDTAVARSMSRTLGMRHLTAVNAPQPTVVSGGEPPQLRDWRSLRRYSRLGFGAAALATFFFLAPLSAIIPVGTALVSEQVINAQEKRQREIIRQHMAGLVRRSIDQYVSQVASRIREVYADLASSLRQEQETWSRSAQAVLSRDGSVGERDAWTRVIADADKLCGEIVDALV